MKYGFCTSLKDKTYINVLSSKIQNLCYFNISQRYLKLTNKFPFYSYSCKAHSCTANQIELDFILEITTCLPHSS